MRAKTQNQKIVVSLSEKLPPISAAQTSWARDVLVKDAIHISKWKLANQAWCTSCGEARLIEGEIDKETTTTMRCPKCGKEHIVIYDRKKHDDIQTYMTIATIVKTKCANYQVLRHVLVTRKVKMRLKPYFNCVEAVQEWIRESDGKRVVIARPRDMYGRFVTTKEMKLKDEPRDYYDWYEIDGWYYPRSRFLASLKMMGITRKTMERHLTSKGLRYMLQGNCDYEYCIKTKQMTVLQFLVRHGLAIVPHKASVNICIRNGYKIKDVSMWMDYIALLEYFHLDTHNAHYVCPANLKKEHDKLMLRKERKEAKEEEERQRKLAIEREKYYKDAKGKYFGLSFTENGIEIRVISSVLEMYEEGKAMHHCVATYYNRADSLILTARDEEGRRLETIEVNLKTMKIIQSRAVCNGESKRHQDILNIVNAHMGEIQKRKVA